MKLTKLVDCLLETGHIEAMGYRYDDSETHTRILVMHTYPVKRLTKLLTKVYELVDNTNFEVREDGIVCRTL